MAHSTRTTALIALLAASALPAAAQSDGRPRFELAAVYSTALVEDANGTDVGYAIAPALGAGYAWTLSPGLSASLGARATRAGVEIDYAGSRQSAGSGWIIDVRAALEREVARCGAPPSRGCTSIHAGLGALWAGGPGDVAPFTVERGAMLAGEVGAAVRVATTLPLFFTGAAQAFRMGGATVDDPIQETGTVVRFLVGVRHGR